MIHDVIPDMELTNTRSSFDRIGILWDGSFSRHRLDKGAEYQLLAKLLEKINLNSQIDIDIIVFREVIEDAITFNSYDVDNLINYLKNLPYDGATRFGNIELPLDKHYNYILLFSDGLNTLGTQTMTLKANYPPIYSITSTNNNDTQNLKYLSQATGGAFFDISAINDMDVVVDSIGKPVFSFIRVETEDGVLSELYPSTIQSIPGKSFTLTGKLNSASASLIINYGYSINDIFHSSKFNIHKDKISNTGLVPLLWAQKKIR